MEKLVSTVAEMNHFTLVLLVIALIVISTTLYNCIDILLRRVAQLNPQKEGLSDILCEIDDIDCFSSEQKHELMNTAI